MREILFRGKSILGKWVEGLPYCEADGVIDCIRVKEQIQDIIFYTTHKVIPETVGQHTGLINRNGKKIFEGDIVKEEYEVFVSARAKEKRVKIGYVEYESNSLCCGYYAYFWNDKEKWRGNFAIHCGCEVIGNIHDNPELMKGGAEE